MNTRTHLKALLKEASEPSLDDARAVTMYAELVQGSVVTPTDDPKLKSFVARVLEAILANPNLSFEARTGMLVESVLTAPLGVLVVPRLLDAYARNEAMALDQLTGALDHPMWSNLLSEVNLWLLRQYKGADYWGRSSDGKGGTFDAQPALEAARRALVDAAKQMRLPHLAGIQVRSGLKGQAYLQHAAQFWREVKMVLNTWYDEQPELVARATRLRVTHAVLTEKNASIGKLRMMEPAFWALVDVHSRYKPTLPSLAPTLGP